MSGFVDNPLRFDMLAHPQNEHLAKVVQPYALRAPEVILGLEWGYAIDIWSLGCMVLTSFTYFPIYMLIKSS